MHEREHDGGGFSLYEGIPDGKNTYYGLSIFNLFDEIPYNLNETIKWVEELQKGRIFGVYGKFNLLNSLVLLGKNPEIADKYINKLAKQKKFPNLEVAYLSTVILKLTGNNDQNHIAEWISTYQNEDGGFGELISDIVSTYYALESLKIIDDSLIKNKTDILNFTKKCQTEEGIFTFTQTSYPP